MGSASGGEWGRVSVLGGGLQKSNTIGKYEARVKKPNYKIANTGSILRVSVEMFETYESQTEMRTETGFEKHQC